MAAILSRPQCVNVNLQCISKTMHPVCVCVLLCSVVVRFRLLSDIPNAGETTQRMWVNRSLKSTRNLICDHNKQGTMQPWTYFMGILQNAFFFFQIEISLEPIDHNSTLFHIRACPLFGAKLLSEPLIDKFTNAYIRHSAFKLSS